MREPLKRIIVVGASGHASVVVDAIVAQGASTIEGLVDTDGGDRDVLGYPLLGPQADLPQLVAGRCVDALVVAIGDNAVRASVVASVEALDLPVGFATVVHPDATVAREVTLSPGAVVLAGGRIGPRSSVGRHCIVNTNASLDHDSVMQDFASLAPGATTGGGCYIGEASAVGIGATLSHDVAIGSDSVVGAGSLVMEDVQANTVVYGVPARSVRSRVRGDRYL